MTRIKIMSAKSKIIELASLSISIGFDDWSIRVQYKNRMKCKSNPI